MQTKFSVMEELEQFKSVVRSAVHVTQVFFLSNPLHRRMCGLVVIFTSKVQQWFHKYAETLKTGMNRSWVVEHLRGAFMQPLIGTMHLLVTEHVLEDLGFLTKFRAKDLHSFAGVAKQCDDEYAASSTGRFVHAPIKRRFLSECMVAVRVAKSTCSPTP